MKNETPLTDFTCINDIKILSNSTISVGFFFCYNLHMESMPIYKKKITKKYNLNYSFNLLVCKKMKSMLNHFFLNKKILYKFS